MSLYLKLDQNQFDVYIEKIYSNISQAQIHLLHTDTTITAISYFHAALSLKNI